ncbi:hypothetical protein BE15_30840 [Sorangium cellulosum]|uniref:Uncharacterized protein n=1 Tax=Sorangium cellulosum TaxID=56 RepID=A0A150QL73_SORCE|nr:hypothetical protein [Sorangium cellulosum]KYF63757.1 hypothetical protein BE11_18555 [Sorangium cellulosum]KYF68693.1 hypothetical protein BE15_30840 [Sorangium cellulosum]
MSLLAALKTSWWPASNDALGREPRVREHRVDQRRVEPRRIVLVAHPRERIERAAGDRLDEQRWRDPAEREVLVLEDLAVPRGELEHELEPLGHADSADDAREEPPLGPGVRAALGDLREEVREAGPARGDDHELVPRREVAGAGCVERGLHHAAAARCADATSSSAAVRSTAS